MKQEYDVNQGLLTKLSHVLTPRDLASAGKLALTWLPGKLLKKLRGPIWVVSETAENARDNGYWFFKYMREQHPEIRTYYPIRSGASDYAKVAELGHTIEFGSLKHYLLFWACERFIGTTKYHGYPEENICSGLTMHNIGSRGNNLGGFKYVFLNHGFARGFSNITNGKTSNYAMFIAMSELEKEILLRYNNQKAERIRPIGFCRHDNLNDSLLDPKAIVVMPTWRRWLDFRHETDEAVIEETKEKYLASQYYQQYNALLTNERFLQFLEEEDLHLIFYLHGYAQYYSRYFECKSPRVVIAAKEKYFVQDLLKQAAYLVTDYSSVAFDYAYMHKPMAYFQFDAEEFASIQYAESELYTYKDNGFGPIVTDVESLVDTIIASYENGFRMEDLYRERVDSFFPSFGTDHCEQTYALIRDL